MAFLVQYDQIVDGKICFDARDLGTLISSVPRQIYEHRSDLDDGIKEGPVGTM